MLQCYTLTMRHLLSWLAISLSAAGVFAADPDFGPNVFVFDPAGTNTQQQIRTVFKEQERAQFGKGRYAFLLKPGRYELDVPVGFYTHVAGLGKLPDDVSIVGHVWTDAAWMNRNATCNFWRTVENLSVEPPDGVNVWAVSQAAPLRRTRIKGDLHLSSGGWSSGGFMADCQVDGTVKAGSQQQWFSRDSAWKEWQGLNWNMVFVGCENPPMGEWPQRAVTRIAKTPVIREKPFLVFQDGAWFVNVPPLRQASARAPGEALPIGSFYIAKAGVDTAANHQRRPARREAPAHDAGHLPAGGHDCHYPSQQRCPRTRLPQPCAGCGQDGVARGGWRRGYPQRTCR